MRPALGSESARSIFNKGRGVDDGDAEQQPHVAPDLGDHGEKRVVLHRRLHLHQLVEGHPDEALSLKSQYELVISAI